MSGAAQPTDPGVASTSPSSEELTGTPPWFGCDTLELATFGKLYHPSGRDFLSMAVDAAKYGHAQVHYPVEYRPRVNFRPYIPAPLDFATRAAEVYHLDRELDRAVLHSNDFSDLVRETVGGQPGPASMFRRENPTLGSPLVSSPPRAIAGLEGGARRQFLLNARRFSAERMAQQTIAAYEHAATVHSARRNGRNDGVLVQ